MLRTSWGAEFVSRFLVLQCNILTATVKICSFMDIGRPHTVNSTRLCSRLTKSAAWNPHCLENTFSKSKSKAFSVLRCRLSNYWINSDKLLYYYSQWASKSKALNTDGIALLFNIKPGNTSCDTVGEKPQWKGLRCQNTFPLQFTQHCVCQRRSNQERWIDEWKHLAGVSTKSQWWSWW